MKRLGFNDGWEFSRDDGPFEAVVVPHDAMLGNRRSPDAPAGSASGYYYGARYVYRDRVPKVGVMGRFEKEAAIA